MKALFICGSLNQTKMMYEISKHLPQFNSYFTSYYADGIPKFAQRIGILECTVLGGIFQRQTLDFLTREGVSLDQEGVNGPYDLVVTCSDILIQKNIRNSKIVLVQEGMTDPETIMFHLVKAFNLPRWFAYTAATGLSHAYDLFCVASAGFKDHFVGKGCEHNKIRVTGIPNFDNCISFMNNDFPHQDYLLVATSDRRETNKYENRRKFIHRALTLADGRQVIFKFHPNENHSRAAREVERYAPNAEYYCEGNTDHMIANCSALFTRFSSVVFPALVLGKKIYSDLSYDFLKRLAPIQNGGKSAQNIANECLTLFN